MPLVLATDVTLVGGWRKRALAIMTAELCEPGNMASPKLGLETRAAGPGHDPDVASAFPISALPFA